MVQHLFLPTLSVDAKSPQKRKKENLVVATPDRFLGDRAKNDSFESKGCRAPLTVKASIAKTLIAMLPELIIHQVCVVFCVCVCTRTETRQSGERDGVATGDRA